MASIATVSGSSITDATAEGFSAGCTADAAGCTADAVGCTADAAGCTADAVGWLAMVADRVSRLPIDGHNGDGLKALVVEARRVRRAVDNIVIRAGVAAKHRETGSLSPATEAVVGELGGDDPRTSAVAGPAGAVSEEEGLSFDDIMRSGGGVDRAATVRRDKTRAEALAQLPAIAAAVGVGRIEPDHLDTIARAWRRFPNPDDATAVLDTPDLIAEAERLPADTFERSLWQRVNSAMADQTKRADAEKKRRASEFRHWFDDDAGMGRFTGRLDPERYEALTVAVEQHMTSLANTGGVTKDTNLAAAALVELVAGSGRRSRSLPHITVVVGANGPETGEGRPITNEAAERLACDAIIRRVTIDVRGVPVDVGRSHRTATDAQWTALRAIYSTCAWDGCTAPISWCQAHHIHYWEHGGPTDLCNLIPLCNQHHHLVHDRGWRLQLRADNRELTILKPMGSGHEVVAVTMPDRNVIQRE